MSKKLRSQNWFGKTGKDGIIYRAWMKNQGIPDYEFKGKPIIGICNTCADVIKPPPHW
jgi:dihydroxy-acid dehydratase